MLAGLPLLLAATSLGAALAGIVLAGAGIGALFPLTSALHVQASARSADSALGQVLAAGALAAHRRVPRSVVPAEGAP